MKRLRYLRLLEGETETITMSDLRAQPGDLIAQVQQGKTFTVTKQGNYRDSWVYKNFEFGYRNPLWRFD